VGCGAGARTTLARHAITRIILIHHKKKRASWPDSADLARAFVNCLPAHDRSGDRSPPVMDTGRPINLASPIETPTTHVFDQLILYFF
jgi:hypothetical protein